MRGVELLGIRNRADSGASALRRYCEVVLRAAGGSAGKLLGCPSAATAVRSLLIAGVSGSAVVVLAGCGSGADLISNVALPAQQAPGPVSGVDALSPAEIDLQTGKLRLTPAQRGYLDDLGAAGIRPSTELRALSIGSYVCQARAAGQGDRAVRDHVAPMVRSDLADSGASTPQSSVPGPAAEAAIASYVRIALARLC